MVEPRQTLKVVQLLESDSSKQLSDIKRHLLLKRRWQLELVLAYLRWGVVVVWSFAALMFASALLAPMLAIGLLFGVGNVITWLLLRSTKSKNRLQMAQHVATGATWISAIGALSISHGRIATIAPGIFLVLIAIAGMRYRMRGAVVATGVASLCAAAALTNSAWNRDDLDDAAAVTLAIAWIALIILAGIVTGLRSRLSDEARIERTEHWGAERDRYQREVQEVKTACVECQRELQLQEKELARHRLEIEHRKAQLLEYRQERYRITAREMEVLELLLLGITYSRIADRLSISPHTVKAHVRTIGRKLDAPGGRRAVEQRARKLSLLSG